MFSSTKMYVYNLLEVNVTYVTNNIDEHWLTTLSIWPNYSDNLLATSVDSHIYIYIYELLFPPDHYHVSYTISNQVYSKNTMKEQELNGTTLLAENKVQSIFNGIFRVSQSECRPQ